MFGGSGLWSKVLEVESFARKTFKPARKQFSTKEDPFNVYRKAKEQHEWEPTLPRESWYSGSLQYWNKQAPTIDGVLGGYGSVHPDDSFISLKMIEKFKDRISGFESAIDCGAGIGRITKETLLKKFKNVDLLEPAPTLIDEAKKQVPQVRSFY